MLFLRFLNYLGRFSTSAPLLEGLSRLSADGWGRILVEGEGPLERAVVKLRHSLRTHARVQKPTPTATDLGGSSRSEVRQPLKGILRRSLDRSNT